MSLLEALPGIPLPVSEVTTALAEMWFPEGSGDGYAPPSEFRASQMNLILHLGQEVEPSEALNRFDVAIRFAQRYPCRILVLVPVAADSGDELLQGKLFSQCYIGESLREMCCCEALMLGYPPDETGYLENQVSIWLESDLPVYHWFHRVPFERIRKQYLGFVRQCRRIIFDGAVEGAEAARMEWPESTTASDLAFARLLPVRQSVGSFLSGISPQALLDGLSHVTVRHDEAHAAEAQHLMRWNRGCLEECCRRVGTERGPGFACEELDPGERICLEIEWTYRSRKFFRWSAREESCTASLQADFGEGKVAYPLQVRFLRPEEALSEALYFGT